MILDLSDKIFIINEQSCLPWKIVNDSDKFLQIYSQCSDIYNGCYLEFMYAHRLIYLMISSNINAWNVLSWGKTVNLIILSH